VFPTTDTAVLTLSRIQDILDNYVTFNPPLRIAETLVIKSKFYPSLKAHGVPHPQTFDPGHVDLADIVSKASFPVFVRPVQTLLYLKHFRGKGFVARTRHELQRVLQRARDVGVQVLVQEIIHGPTENGYYMQGYLDRASQPLLVASSRKIRQPGMFANTSVDISIPRSQILKAETTLLAYLHAIGYHGLFGAEFKRDPRDGQLKLLEVNARSVGGNNNDVAIGANSVLLAYRDTLGEPVQPITQYAHGVYDIDVLTDLYAVPVLLYHRQISLREIITPYSHRNSYNLFSRSDPRPIVTALHELLRAITTHALTR
jgi:predicted ATP-grasp superfamily ATP-dependent carboligase